MSVTESQDDMIKSRTVLEFLTVANEYCLLIEKCKNYPRESLLQIIYRILPLIYLKGSLLPEITPEDEAQQERYVTEEQWEERLKRTKGYSGKYRYLLGHPPSGG
jgi:hypothetical protein